MDRIKETTNIIISLNKYKRGELADSEFIKLVCTYFDVIKNEELEQNDFKFLKYIANSSGIPHFYNILKKFDQHPDITTFDLNTLSAIMYECILHTDDKSMLHKYQKNIADKFEHGKLNRFFLSASTSFGKTHLVFEVIKKMKYTNVVLIFPTIALLSENLERILSDEDYSFLEIITKSILSVKLYKWENRIFLYTHQKGIYLSSRKVQIK